MTADSAQKPALAAEHTLAPTGAAISSLAVMVIAANIGQYLRADIGDLKIGVVLGLAVDMGTLIERLQ